MKNWSFVRFIRRKTIYQNVGEIANIILLTTFISTKDIESITFIYS